MTQGELEALALPLQKKMSDLEERIMEDIVRKIKENGFSSASTDWQITRLQQLGKTEEEIKQWIKEELEATDEDLDRIFSDEVYKEYYKHDRVYKLAGSSQVPLEEDTELLQLIEGIRQQTGDTFQNMTAFMGFAIRNPATGKIAYSPLMEYYQNTLDAAVLDIASGAFDYQTVLNRTIFQMTASGLRWIDYESGWHNRVDVAARRAVLTGFRLVQGKINEGVARDLHTDSYEVTYHVGARPTHQPWQGRVWTYEELQSVCGLGEVTGLHGANCNHDYNPFIPGVSIRTYTDDQLDQMIEEENTPVDYYGKQYTTYEALQKQRQMETSMRATRQQIKLLKEGEADEETIMLKKAKYQGQMQTYKDFSKKMGLPEQVERVYSGGLSKSHVKSASEKKQAEFLMRSHVPGENTTRERIIAIEVIAAVPDKVQKALHSGTIIDVGKIGASQYDYVHDILYVAKGSEKEEIIHEIGHLVENKVLNPDKTKEITRKIVGEVDYCSIRTVEYYDNNGNAREILVLDNDKFVSEYQGRIYADTLMEAFDEDGEFRYDLLWEMYSEPFRVYCENPNELKSKCQEIYELIKEAVE